MKRGAFLLVLLSFLLLSFAFVSASELRVTSNHPFLINNGWIEASQLQVGDLLTTIEGKHARITSIEDVFANVSVYNLEDEFLHNYVAGFDNIVVHNSNLVNNKRLTTLASEAANAVGEKISSTEVISSIIKLDPAKYRLNANEFFDSLISEMKRINMDSTQIEEFTRLSNLAKQLDVPIYRYPELTKLTRSGAFVNVDQFGAYIVIDTNYRNVLAATNHELNHVDFFYRLVSKWEALSGTNKPVTAEVFNSYTDRLMYFIDREGEGIPFSGQYQTLTKEISLSKEVSSTPRSCTKSIELGGNLRSLMELDANLKDIKFEGAMPDFLNKQDVYLTTAYRSFDDANGAFLKLMANDVLNPRGYDIRFWITP